MSLRIPVYHHHYSGVPVACLHIEETLVFVQTSIEVHFPKHVVSLTGSSFSMDSVISYLLA